MNTNFKSNNAGGILGGISSGQEIIVSFAVKPTSSILTSRKTIDKFGKNTSISVKGRHDPCWYKSSSNWRSNDELCFIGPLFNE